MPERTSLQIEMGETWVPVPLISLSPSGVTFLYSTLTTRMVPGRRVRGRLILGGSQPLPVQVEVCSVQVAPGTGERWR